MMVRSIVIPVLAAAGLAFAIYTTAQSNKPVIPAPPIAAPAASPFGTPVAGAGIVESSTQNIAIGTNVGGVVSKVFVKVGDAVKAGTPLFQIDDRTLRAELRVREAAVAVAEQTVAKWKAAPRAEDLPPAESRIAEAKAVLADAQTQLKNAEAVRGLGVMSQEELDRRSWAVEVAKAKVTSSEADLARIRAGTWKMDVAVAEAELQSARVAIDTVKTEIDRLTVKAPVDGQVLQVNIRTGEYAQSGPGASTTPLMLFGNTDTLHVRVDIDENDAWRVNANAAARATLRGNSALGTALTFVRIEPYVVPKKSLTGDSAERVDTRVLQVVYAFSRGSFPVYVGQQMDVFIDAAPNAKPAETTPAQPVK